MQYDSDVHEPVIILFRAGLRLNKTAVINLEGYSFRSGHMQFLTDKLKRHVSNTNELLPVSAIINNSVCSMEG